MKTYTALFHAYDRGRGITTIRRRGKLINKAPASYFHDWVVKQMAEVEGDHPGISFSGLFPDGDGAFVTAEEMMAVVGSFHEGRSSDFFSRHAHLSDEAQNAAATGALGPVVEDCADRGFHIWYDEEAGIPTEQRPHFAEYTLIYLDLAREEVELSSVFLYSDFEAALTKFLIDEPYGTWEPIALFAGSVESELSPDELEESPYYRKYEQEVVPAAGGGGSAQGEGRAERALPAPRPARPVAEVLAEELVREAVRGAALDTRKGFAELKREGDDEIAFLARILREKRPLAIVESQYWEIAEQIGRFVADAAGVEFAPANGYYSSRRSGGGGTGPQRLVYYDDALFNADFDLDRNAVRGLLKDLVASKDIGFAVVSNPRAVPLTFQNYTDLEMALPPLVGEVRDRVFAEILGPGALGVEEADKWSRYLLPFDFDKVMGTGLTGAEAVKELRLRVERRLARKSPNNAPPLAEIHGLGEAKELAEQLVSDIRGAVTGEIDWGEVDRGMLLSGPPGTGKTMLARSISKEAGVRFIAGSALEWQAAGALDSHLAAIREFFAEARRYAPTIVFIDEFDAIGNRQHHQGRNDFYTTAVVNCVLEELQGFHDREGVVVIAATNEESKIDPALKRAGRLDQVVTIKKPTVRDLAKIYEYHIGRLAEKGLVADDIDRHELAKLTVGQSGADVEFYVRGARRRARKDGRKVSQKDLVSEIMRKPLGATGEHRMTEEEIRRTAVHEAGHAMVQLLGPNKGEDISFISIIPRPDGTLGFVASYRERVDMKKADVIELVQVFLGGRAAEETVYGPEEVGAGAGGSTRSDLAQATRLLMRMYAQHGYSEAEGLFWRDVDRIELGDGKLPPKLEREIKRTLELCYRKNLRLIARNRRLLDHIVATLVDEQEMTGPELRDLVKRYKSPLGRFRMKRKK